MLPKEQQQAIETKIEALQKELGNALEQLPQLEKHRREQIQKFNSEITAEIVDTLIKALTAKFSGINSIERRLREVRDDIVKHADIFIEREDAEHAGPFPKYIPDATLDVRFHRYLVNVVIANDGDGDKMGAPLIAENHPTLANIVGRVEHISQFGALTTDFTMIRPGALHRANGGYLVLDARKVLTEPFAWEALKRALRSETIAIVSAAEQLSLVSTISLEPEPIPLDIKVVLIGERILYYLLSSLDSEFSELFKVEADFDEELPTTDDNIELYSRFIAATAKRDELCPLDAQGVARVIEEIGRLAADAERLSLNVGRLTNLLGEADYWARAADRSIIGAADVERAVTEQIRRVDRLRQRSQEVIERGTIMIDADGGAIGQINGLSVLSLGNTSFGRPARITARARMGSGKVVDIERETNLGGPLHSKGVLIRRVTSPPPTLSMCRCHCGRVSYLSSPTVVSMATALHRLNSMRCCRHSPALRSINPSP